MPKINATEKPNSVSPPRNASAITTSIVEPDVTIVRDSTWFTDVFTIDSAEHREHRAEHGQIELPADEREQSDRRDHVVELRDDRAGRELPTEAQRHVQ